MDLSICVTSWNTRDLLHRCLASVYNSTRGPEFEILVVDNASDDGSAEMIRREFPAVRLFENETNVGFAAGSNRAVTESRGRNVLLLNSDTVVFPGTLRAMVEYLDAFPDVGVVGCKLLNPDGTVQVSYHRFPTLTWSYLKDILRRKIFHHVRALRPALWGLFRAGMPDGPRPVDWVSGACLMARKPVFEQVGLLDERFFMFCEEIDWCYRVRRAGWQIHYLPDVHIVHYGGQSSRQQRLRTYWTLLRSSYQYFRKVRTHDVAT